MKKLFLLAAFSLSAAIGLSGCGSTTTADNGSATNIAKTAKANFSVTIPQKATKSLIPSGTSYVYVSWYGYDTTTGSYAPGELYLTPDASGKATGSADLIPGIYQFTAYCYDVNGNTLSEANSYAAVSQGANDIIISFLNGRWSFVDSNNNAAPISLTSGEVLNSFDLTSFDTSDYLDMTWNKNDGSIITSQFRYMPFYGNLADLASQFGYSLPSNSTSVVTNQELIYSSYNLTQQSVSNSVSYENEGDHVFMMTSVDPSMADYSFYYYQDFMGTTTYSPSLVSSYFNTKLESGTKMTGTIIEYVAGAVTSETDTGKSCTISYPGYNQPAKRPVVSKSSLLGTVTFTTTMCYPSSQSTTDTTTLTGTEWQKSQTFTNVNVYPFTAVASDLQQQGVIAVKRSR